MFRESYRYLSKYKLCMAYIKRKHGIHGIYDILLRTLWNIPEYEQRISDEKAP